jgi:ankyrin repeat protein
MLYILPGCSFSSDEGNIPIGDRGSLCDSAMQGELKIKKYRLDNANLNSYMLNCALAVIVSYPDESKESVQVRREKKLQIADYLLAQDLNPNYKDESGGTLLMAVIISFMPDNWKLKAAEALLLKGVNIDTTNMYGKTAYDLAKFSGDPMMLNLINDYLKRN